jgi:hypothetical protein
MLFEVAKKQAAMCNDDSVTYINCLITCEGMRGLMTTVYNALINTKRAIKIEDLSLEEKNTLWLQTKEFANNQLNLQETIKLSKCLYSIEYFLTQ